VIEEVDTFLLQYPEGPQNAEAFFVHPEDNSLYIITKNATHFNIYSWSGSHQESLQTLTFHNRIQLSDLDYVGSTLITAAAITQDGSTLILRTYTSIIALDTKVLLRDTQELPEICIIESAGEAQGESLTFIQNDTRYITISEGQNPTIFSFGFSQNN
jgi:hypothetical protein